MSRWMRRFGGAAVLAAAVVTLAIPQNADAWWRGGVFMGISPAPFVWGPHYWGPRYYAPYYYAPPVVAYPPPIYAPPPAYVPAPSYSTPRASGPACYAGQYVCPLARPAPAGADCTCPSEGGRVPGRVG